MASDDGVGKRRSDRPLFNDSRVQSSLGLGAGAVFVFSSARVNVDQPCRLRGRPGCLDAVRHGIGYRQRALRLVPGKLGAKKDLGTDHRQSRVPISFNVVKTRFRVFPSANHGNGEGIYSGVKRGHLC